MSQAAMALESGISDHGSDRRAGVLHICNGLVPHRDGGMVPSILGFTGALARLEGGVTIVTPTASDRDSFGLPDGICLRGPVRNYEALIRQSELLHIHGLWQEQTRRGGMLARRHRVPYLVTTHGMADPWALRQKALKKRIYTALIEGKNLRRASCLHALSVPEIGHLRSLAPKTPICLVPNGVDLAPFQDLPDRSAFEAEYPQLAGKFLLLFFGRLHHKKGLDLLAQAVATLAREHKNLHVVLAGTDDGAQEPFVALAESLGVGDRLTFLGHVAGEAARRVWGAADAFILPSYSEGFSMAVLEALAARLPTVITTPCHFGELAEAEGGLVAIPTVPGITTALRLLLERTPTERAEMAARGRALIEARYTWERQAARLDQVYRWVVGGGHPPEAVVDPGWVSGT